MVHEYITLAQYPVFFMLLGMGGSILGSRKSLRFYLFPLLFFTPAAIIAFYCFSKQYEIHDYYFICTFLPLVAYCLAISLIALRHVIHERDLVRSVRMGLSCAVLAIYFFADYQNSLRMHMDLVYDHDYSFRWSEGGAGLLTRLHIPANERIVVADENAPNLALVYFDRKGYHISADSWEKGCCLPEALYG